MSIKLTDTQFVVLSAAAQREDRCLTLPKGLKGSAAQKISAKLLPEGLVREIRAKPGAPVWRRDEKAETSYSLKLTAAGMKAIAVNPPSVDKDDDRSAKSGASPDSQAAAPAHPDSEAAETKTNPTAFEIASVTVSDRPTLQTPSPREGTKMAGVIDLLKRDGGATLAELIATTGWLPHTVGAAFTGLPKRGLAVTLDRSSKERGSTYAIPSNLNAADEAPKARAIEPSPTPSDRTKKLSRRAKSEPAALAASGSAV